MHNQRGSEEGPDDSMHGLRDAWTTHRWCLGKVHEVGPHMPERKSAHNVAKQLVELYVQAQGHIVGQRTATATNRVQLQQQATQDGKLRVVAPPKK